jgi:hypothetical protein
MAIGIIRSLLGRQMRGVTRMQLPLSLRNRNGVLWPLPQPLLSAYAEDHGLAADEYEKDNPPRP